VLLQAATAASVLKQAVMYDDAVRYSPDRPTSSICWCCPSSRSVWSFVLLACRVVRQQSLSTRPGISSPVLPLSVHAGAAPQADGSASAHHRAHVNVRACLGCPCDLFAVFLRASWDAGLAVAASPRLAAALTLLLCRSFSARPVPSTAVLWTPLLLFHPTSSPSSFAGPPTSERECSLRASSTPATRRALPVCVLRISWLQPLKPCTSSCPWLGLLHHSGAAAVALLIDVFAPALTMLTGSALTLPFSHFSWWTPSAFPCSTWKRSPTSRFASLCCSSVSVVRSRGQSSCAASSFCALCCLASLFAIVVCSVASPDECSECSACPCSDSHTTTALGVYVSRDRGSLASPAPQTRLPHALSHLSLLSPHPLPSCRVACCQLSPPAAAPARPE
jgi:hypothetical protein